MVGPRASLSAQLATFAALLLHAGAARADLDADADRLARAWKARGAEVQRLEPMFVEHGKNKRIDLAAKKSEGEAECLSIAVLGALTADFAVSPDPLTQSKEASSSPLPQGHPLMGGLVDRSVRSAVGAAALSRCGASRRDLLRLVLDMRSPRGALEIVVARSAGPLGDLREIMPERAFGPVAPRGNPGRPIEPGPLAPRVAHAELRAKSERAKFARVPMVASPEGAGEFLLRMESGCHRVDLMAEVPSFLPRRATDLDAEARIGEDGRVLARDRGEAADARLDFCIGETTRVAIPYGGAAGPVMVVAADASWPIPTAVPVHWGSRPRAGFAMALRRRHAPEPPSPPIAESLGSGGSTMIPVAVEPGRCYLAGVAIARGEPRGLRITAAVGDRYAKDEVAERGDGAALAFCAENEDTARIEVEARGDAIWWTFALWPLGGAP